jgi:Tfp pilus assembly protein PilF
VILIHQHRYADAVATLKPLTEDILYQTPENAWGNLGWAYLEQGDLEQAIVALKRSIAAQPSFCVGHHRLGLAYEKKQDAQAALAEFDRAVAATAQCSGLQQAHAGRARALFRLGRSDDARTALDDCLRLDKNSETGRECRTLQGKLE